MEDVLTSLNLEGLVDAFAANLVTPKEAVGLTDTEFELLGVGKVGDRVRIRQKCQEILDSETRTLPVIQRLRNIVKTKRQEAGKKSEKSSGSNGQIKATLRLLTGWKHRERDTGRFKLMTAGRGGGSLALDLARESSLDTVQQKIEELYFPGGVNECTGLSLKDLFSRVATFSGADLPMLISGKPFSLGEFFATLNTHPVRVYLQTSFKDEMLTTSDDDDLPDIFSRPSRRTHERENSTPEVTQPETPTITFKRAPTVRSNPYTEYINLIDDDDDTEEENMCFLTEPTAEKNSGVEGVGESLQEILCRHMAETTGNKHTVIINRRRVLQSTFLAVKADGFNFLNTPYVIFAGEDGEDEGGPRREFFRLLMKDVSDSMGVFEKRSGKLYFTYDIACLREGKYKLAGQLVRWSLLHGGSGLFALSPYVYNLMTESTVELDETDVPDIATQENLKKIMSSTPDNFKAVISDITEWLVDQGVTNVHMCTFERRSTLIRDLLTHTLYYRVQPAIFQFEQGLGPLWEDIRRYPDTFRPIFVWKAAPALTFAEMRKLYTVHKAPIGSNNRALEEDTLYCFEVVLEKASTGQAEISLENILEFWTAAERVPPCGFKDGLHVEFYPREPGIKRLPSSSTCAEILRLPRGVADPNELQEMLEFAVRNAPGFGKI